MIETTYLTLRSHPFLTGLSDRQLDRLSMWGYTTMFHRDSRLFAEGGRADRFWLVDDGHVRLSTNVPGRGEVVVETLGPGSVIGWSWLFPPYRWQFTGTAEDVVHAVALDGPGVRELCAADPALGYELMRRFTGVIAERLSHTRARLLAVEPAGEPAAIEPEPAS
ncbi:CRP-like cAMP-binding protein [Hamadaea flava]|uniref:Cyclic nucleotide-binding domain-containing protein n=1 Tax=Hamadaea flava TaxID=1742688 RepID=A0ABV8LXK2_9ACTN|nr:cyclic nucleotide-binding domain-containing protein [Hamadaea flava]MCP2329364.1 CRP-like cAMP-binding protein [Hamadaea flava]